MSAPDESVLSVSHLSKQYGDVAAVNDVSFKVRRGEILGLLGPNGAGKTTTISMILGLLTPSSGTIQIDGIDALGRRSEALSRTGFAAAYAPLPGNLTVAQNLRFFGMLYGVASPAQRIERMLTDFDLTRFRDTKCGVLSSGEQARLSMAKAFLNEPRMLLLDEPTSSLDPSAAADVRARIKAHVKRTNAGVLWTSHNMFEVEDVCDRVLFLSRGTILLEGDPRALPAQHGHTTLEELFIAVAREPLSLSES